MMKTNYHTHTFYCGHARGTPKDYIEEAIKNKFDILGFSEHAYLPDVLTFKDRMSLEKQNEFRETINKLKILYKDKLEIYVGLELDYFEDLDYYYESIKNDFDYFGLSLHFYQTKDPLNHSSYCVDNYEKALKYKELMIKGIKSGYFNFICHADLFLNGIREVTKDIYELLEEIVITAKEYKLPFEINMNAFRRKFIITKDGPSQPYTRKEFLELLSKHQAEVVISSDCHDPELLADEYFIYGYELVKKYKLNLIDRVIKQ